MSLYDPDVTSVLCETRISKFFNRLKKSEPTVAASATFAVPPNTPKIFGRMVLFQKLLPTLKTFGHVSIVIIDFAILANVPSIKHTRRYLPRVWKFRRTGDVQRVWKQFGEGGGECSSCNTCY